MLGAVALDGLGILVRDNEGSARVVRLVGKRAVPGEGVEEQDVTGSDADGDGSVKLGQAVFES